MSWDHISLSSYSICMGYANEFIKIDKFAANLSIYVIKLNSKFILGTDFKLLYCGVLDW